MGGETYMCNMVAGIVLNLLVLLLGSVGVFVVIES